MRHETILQVASTCVGGFTIAEASTKTKLSLAMELINATVCTLLQDKYSGDMTHEDF